jgi:hypothetical protein
MLVGAKGVNEARRASERVRVRTQGAIRRGREHVFHALNARQQIRLCGLN